MRLIDADKLGVQFNNLVKSFRGTFSGLAYSNALERIKDAPTVDAVEVVRCEDCKYFGTDACAFDTYAFDVTEDSFCSYGERKVE